MPIPEHFLPILDVLEQSSLPPWQETAAPDHFTISVDHYTIEIGPIEESSAYAFIFARNEGLKLVVFDEKGELIDSFAAKQSDSDYGRLLAIHQNARRVAKKVDEKFKDLAKQLKVRLKTPT